MAERAKWNLDARVKPKSSKYKSDGSLDMSEPIGDEFDEVLDPLNELMTGKVRSLSKSAYGGQRDDNGDPIATARRREEMHREMEKFIAGIYMQLEPLLKNRGLVLEDVVRHDPTYNLGVFVVDREGRRFDVELSMDEELALIHMREDQAFRLVVNKLLEMVVGARDAYMSRVNEVLELN